MADVRRFVTDHKLGVSLVAASLVVVGGVAVASGSPDDGSATVVGIVDGDTVDVEIDGEEQRVRLLNVDTPEVDECLHEEATAFLTERIPPGTEVILELDEEHYDRYDRLLAGVVEEDSLVNAEVARAGLGVAVLFEPNDRFYDEVLQAQQAAEAEAIGLFATGVQCTLPAQAGAYVDQAEDLEAQVAAVVTLEQADGWLAEAAAAAAVGAALAEVLDGDDTAFPLLPYTGDRWTLREDVVAATDRLAAADEAVTEVRNAEQQRIEEEKRREREEAERAAREEAERRAAEEAERQAREEAERRAAEEAERAAREEAERRAAEEAARQQPAPGGGGSVYYKNCSAARAAGAAPVYVGEPGYARHLDRDGDGVGCE